MQSALQTLKQPVDEITDEQLEKIEEYIEEEERVADAASEVGMLLFSYIRGRDSKFGNITKTI